jgi:RNA polymerase sigma-54 factor
MMKPSLQLRIGQQLTMTPQLQQAIRLLQLPALELQAQIREALESNVMLEAEEETEEVLSLEEFAASGEDRSGETAEGPETAAEALTVEISEDWPEPTAVESGAPWSGGDDDRLLDLADESGQTLTDHLLWQLELAHLDQRSLMIGRAIVDALNDDGYLTEDTAEIAATLLPEIEADASEIEAVLRLVQQLDPVGVGARSVAECVTLQLAALDPGTPGLELAQELAGKHLDLVADQQYAVLRRQLHCSAEDLDMALTLVRGCHPRPGSALQQSRTEYVIPDVFVRRSPGGWLVELNPSALPRVRLNETYAGMVTRAEDHSVLRGQLQEARWLLRSLEIRNETLLKVARTIVQRQAEFLERGDEAMEPMVLKDVADAIEMHESTVSRVTTGKYMHTPRGVLEFRFFFSSRVAGDGGAEVSSTAIRARIRKLVAAEDPADPLSDSKITEILLRDGIQVARRTVAKYRESMGIASSSERRRVAIR